MLCIKLTGTGTDTIMERHGIHTVAETKRFSRITKSIVYNTYIFNYNHHSYHI